MKSRALFLVLVLLLAGTSENQAINLFTNIAYYKGAGAVPVTLWLSFVLATIAFICAGIGSFISMTKNCLRNLWLLAFAIIYSIVIVSDAAPVKWQFIGLYFVFGSADFRIGPNVIGISILIWYLITSKGNSRIIPSLEDNEKNLTTTT